MSNEFESKLRNAAEKAKPFLESLLSELEMDATSLKDRDLDPRRIVEDVNVQDARNAAADALEHLTALAKSLDVALKSQASEIEKKVDVESLKERIATAPATAREKLEESRDQGIADRIKATGDEARARIESSAHEQLEHVDDLTNRGKEHVSTAAQKGKDTTNETLAALGWAVAAGAVIYAVFMDEKRRQQARSVAKACCDGMLFVVNTAIKRN